MSSGNSSVSPDGQGAADSAAAPAKRSRVLLSCGACRQSKLKCDRAEPCGQCLKKGKPEGCVYVPRPEKQKPTKSMASRLKRLEGMVREMIDTEGNQAKPAPEKPVSEPATGGLVLHGQKAASYVGGTHFMAILEDIEDLKSYFEYPEEEEEEDDQQDFFDIATAPELVTLGKHAPRTREQLLAMLPEKSVLDRLLVRYFTSNSPSQHILHRTTFSREYNEFWRDQSSASYHWLAILFMVSGLGVFFSTFQAPHELTADSPVAAPDRVKQYRNAAGMALVAGKYTQPGKHTLQAFMLFVEAEFLFQKQSQMECYLLCSVLIRMMLKMGLHRDPSKLPNVSPYDGEMRRRIWNLAIQIDLLVAFHLGLPAMINGIESDTTLPRNLYDTDFDEDTKELPSPRSSTDYTPLTYPIFKASLCRCFGLVARQAHSLTIPTYADVMKVDSVIEETYGQIPPFMRVKPLEESITDPPIQVTQRFGLASLYQKSRCVLHRRYITEVLPKGEHAYSRKACLEAALALLHYQNTIFTATHPGGMLAQNGWFLSSLAINDFLLAAMILALIMESDFYMDAGGDPNWSTPSNRAPSKAALLQLLRRSHFIWTQMAITVPDSEKASNVVATLIKRVERKTGISPESSASSDPLTTRSTSDETGSMAGLSITGPATYTPVQAAGINDSTMSDFEVIDPHVVRELTAAQDDLGLLDADWANSSTPYDWNQFDMLVSNGAGSAQALNNITPDNWSTKNPLSELSFDPSTLWSMGPQA